MKGFYYAYGSDHVFELMCIRKERYTSETWRIMIHSEVSWKEAMAPVVPIHNPITGPQAPPKGSLLIPVSRKFKLNAVDVACCNDQHQFENAHVGTLRRGSESTVGITISGQPLSHCGDKLVCACGAIHSLEGERGSLKDILTKRSTSELAAEYLVVAVCVVGAAALIFTGTVVLVYGVSAVTFAAAGFLGSASGFGAVGLTLGFAVGLEVASALAIPTAISVSSIASAEAYSTGFAFGAILKSLELMGLTDSATRVADWSKSYMDSYKDGVAKGSVRGAASLAAVQTLVGSAVESVAHDPIIEAIDASARERKRLLDEHEEGEKQGARAAASYRRFLVTPGGPATYRYEPKSRDSYKFVTEPKAGIPTPTPTPKPVPAPTPTSGPS